MESELREQSLLVSVRSLGDDKILVRVLILVQVFVLSLIS